MSTDTITMSPITGRQFCWFEVNTRDGDAAAAFYCELFGWTRQDQEAPGFAYTTYMKGEVPVAGMMVMDDKWPAEVPPHWMSYIAVTEIENVAARVAECGGSLCVPVTPIPPGKFCVVTDPTGAVFSLFEGGDGVNPTGNGTFGWCELATNDVDQATSFYADLLGWSATSHPGDNTYWCFMEGDTPVAGMLKLPDEWGEGHRSCWTPYVHADEIDALTEKAEALGAHVYQQPVDMGGIVRCSTIQDPTGAVVSMFKPISQECCGDGCNCQE